MPDDFSGTNTQKIDKLVAAVIDIRASLRAMKWVVGLGLPILATFMGLSWRDQANRVSDLQLSVGKLQGSVSEAVEPVKGAADDMRNAARSLKEAAATSNQAAANLKTSSESIAGHIKRIESLTARTQEVSALVRLDHTNLKFQSPHALQMTAPLPDPVIAAKLREIKSRFAGSSGSIPGVSLLLLTARAEGQSYLVQLVVPPGEGQMESGKALQDFIFKKNGAILVDLSFVSIVD